METRRLHLLLELSRLGSMRAVAEAHNLTGIALPVDGGWTAQ